MRRRTAWALGTVVLLLGLAPVVYVFLLPDEPASSSTGVRSSSEDSPSAGAPSGVAAPTAPPEAVDRGSAPGEVTAGGRENASRGPGHAPGDRAAPPRSDETGDPGSVGVTSSLDDPATRSVVRPRVVSARTGEPLAGVRARVPGVWREGAPGPYTDEGGRLDWALSGTTQDVRFSHPAHQDRTVTLRRDEPGAEVALEPLDEVARLEIRCVNDAGSPIPWRARFSSSRLGAEHRFDLGPGGTLATPIAPGTWRIRVGSRGVRTEGRDLEISLEPGQRESRTVELVRWTQVVATVHGGEDAARLAAQLRFENGLERRTIRVEDGRATFELPSRPGELSIVGSGRSSEEVRFEPAPGETLRHSFHLGRAPVQLTGRVVDATTGRGIEGAAVGFFAETTTTEADGSFVFRLARKPSLLQVSATGYVSETLPLDETEEPEPPSFVVELIPSGSLALTVRDERGEPHAGLTVVAVHGEDPGRSERLRLGDEGRVRVDGLAIGEWEIRLSGGSPALGTVRVRRGDTTEATVTIPRG